MSMIHGPWMGLNTTQLHVTPGQYMSIHCFFFSRSMMGELPITAKSPAHHKTLPPSTQPSQPQFDPLNAQRRARWHRMFSLALKRCGRHPDRRAPRPFEDAESSPQVQRSFGPSRRMKKPREEGGVGETATRGVAVSKELVLFIQSL